MNNWILGSWGLLGILICHWIFDFILQPDAIAKSKWYSMPSLLLHAFTYSICWWLVLTFTGQFSPKNVVAFTLITLGLHGITDLFTSRWTHYYFSKKDTHNGFIIIGLDQILHYVQLYLTFKLII